MAESRSMTTAEVVRKTLIDEHADFLKEAVAMFALLIEQNDEWLVGRHSLSEESIALVLDQEVEDSPSQDRKEVAELKSA